MKSLLQVTRFRDSQARAQKFFKTGDIAPIRLLYRAGGELPGPVKKVRQKLNRQPKYRVYYKKQPVVFWNL